MLEGLLPFTKRETDMRAVKQPRNTRISIITGNPDEAFALASLPVHGVGLARLEFIISRIGLHPQACLDYEQMPAADKDRMRQMTLGAASPAEFYVQRIAEGVATIAAAFYPNPVIVRMSDFKTNEVRLLTLCALCACGWLMAPSPLCAVPAPAGRRAVRAQGGGAARAACAVCVRFADARPAPSRRRTRCWASAARRATTRPPLQRRSGSNARRWRARATCSGCATSS